MNRALRVKLHHRVAFHAAFDKRHADPKQDYGVCGVVIHFVVEGERGEAWLEIVTDWQLPHIVQAGGGRCIPVLHFHSPTPFHDDQLPDRASCEQFGGRLCYSDTQYMAADAVWERLLIEGDTGLWAALEEHYWEAYGYRSNDGQE